MRFLRVRRICFVLLILGVVAFAAYWFWAGGRLPWLPPLGKATLEQRVAELAPKIGPLWNKRFSENNAPFPPSAVVLTYFKDERILRIVVPDTNGKWIVLVEYAVLAASGQVGPKLREGDRQVPEGIYAVESLNPNSRFRLALRLNYPSEVDREFARREGRANLGGDIMIHGNSVSIGCLAIGDEAIEEVFYLAAQSAIEHWTVLLAPIDLRKESAPAVITPIVLKHPWMGAVYSNLHKSLEALP